LALFCGGHALAGSLPPGGEAISYATPKGLARSDGFMDINLAGLDEDFGLHTLIFAQYISAKDIALITKLKPSDKRPIPGWYAHLSYDEKYADAIQGKTLFSVVTSIIEKILAHQYRQPAFIRKLERVVGGALKRKTIIESMQSQDFIEEKPGQRSILAHGRGKLENDGGDMIPFEMACMTTFFLWSGHWITLVQVSRLDSETNLPAFTATALRIAAEIKKPENPLLAH
jgi:hypothetical protein